MTNIDVRISDAKLNMENFVPISPRDCQRTKAGKVYMEQYVVISPEDCQTANNDRLTLKLKKLYINSKDAPLNGFIVLPPWMRMKVEIDMKMLRELGYPDTGIRIIDDDSEEESYLDQLKRALNESGATSEE